jgi:hypothetical protein
MKPKLTEHPRLAAMRRATMSAKWSHWGRDGGSPAVFGDSFMRMAAINKLFGSTNRVTFARILCKNRVDLQDA